MASAAIDIIRARQARYRLKIRHYELLISELEDEAEYLIEKAEDSCDHIKVSWYQGSLTHQKVVQCDDCLATLDTGYDAFPDGGQSAHGHDIKPMSMRPKSR